MTITNKLAALALIASMLIVGAMDVQDNQPQQGRIK